MRVPFTDSIRSVQRSVRSSPEPLAGEGRLLCVKTRQSLIRQSVGLLQPVSLGTGVTVCTRGTYTLLPSTGCLVAGTWRVLVTRLPLPALFLLCTNKHVFRGLDGKEDQGRE